MINISECNKQADKIDDIIINLNTVINNYEESLYYVKKNDSNDASTISKTIETNIQNLENEKNKLISTANKIRTSAKQIYELELEMEEELRRQQEQEQMNESASTPQYGNYSSN